MEDNECDCGLCEMERDRMYLNRYWEAMRGVWQETLDAYGVEWDPTIRL